MPPKIDTALPLTTPPLAEAPRYNALLPALQKLEADQA
jgi:hypothetical protein